MNLENRLRDIETDRRNRLHDLLRIMGCPNSTQIQGTLVPVEEPSTASSADIWSARSRDAGRATVIAARSMLAARLWPSPCRECAPGGSALRCYLRSACLAIT